MTCYITDTQKLFMRTLRFSQVAALLGVNLIFIVFQPDSAKAACGSATGSGWTINLKTGNISKKTVGTVTSCGNMSGSFSEFSGKSFKASWSTCQSNCSAGYVSGNQYVTVNGKTTIGNVQGDIRSPYCVSQLGSNTKYCWK